MAVEFGAVNESATLRLSEYGAVSESDEGRGSVDVKVMKRKGKIRMDEDRIWTRERWKSSKRSSQKAVP